MRNADTFIFFVEGVNKTTETMLFVSWTGLYNTVYDILFCALSDNHENMKIHRTLGRFYVHRRTSFFFYVFYQTTVEVVVDVSRVPFEQ